MIHRFVDLVEPTVEIVPYCVYDSGFTHGDLWYVPRAGGSPVLSVTAATDHELRWPEPSVDSSRIVYVDNDTNTGIGVVKAVNPDGSGSVTLGTSTTGGFANRMMPRWSPDGTMVAYTDYQTVGATTTVRLKVVNADGTGTVTVYTTTTSTVIGYSWRRDSAKLVFHADGQIRTVNPDGTGAATVLTIGSCFTQYGTITDTIYYYSGGPRSVAENGTGDTSLGTDTGTSPLVDRYLIDPGEQYLFWTGKEGGGANILHRCPTGGGTIDYYTGLWAAWVGAYGSRIYSEFSVDSGSTVNWASVALDGTDYRVEDSTANNRIFPPFDAFG